ncbi:Carbohydrate kinase, FGGY [Pararhodospirillum photometricum DSM 122]|uniref:Carbohydrate kinase, FGGY n=1 Tax=Pararhodospirillum photometricum DSM 122 TaxID=1150469 RepID=H6SPV7_PARPM|nr:Carbohydrate kinase, FGGY [Pararhodospirillum photometricum DSM 122]
MRPMPPTRRAPCCSTSTTSAGTPDLLELFGVPLAMMPEVRDSAALFGHTDPEIYGRPVPIGGIAGDQHAALIGQGCVNRGMVKSTYGTGCFMLANTGPKPLPSHHRLLTTLAYRLQGEPTYALEGSIFNAGTSVQWLRDELGVIGQAATSEVLARGLKNNRGVYFVPAFTGLGRPLLGPAGAGRDFWVGTRYRRGRTGPRRPGERVLPVG